MTTQPVVQDLVRDLVDYAGLFPPASLPMAPAVSEYHALRRHAQSWALGRFVVAADQLEDFDLAAPAEAWRLSVLLRGSLDADLTALRAFTARRPRMAVGAVELKAANPVEIAQAARRLPVGPVAFFEIPLGPGLTERIAAVAASGGRAEVRMGGMTPDQIPEPHDVVDFLVTCARARVPFKATAGMHHPLRAARALAPGRNSPRGVTHGLVNVVVAAAFVHAGLDPRLAVEIVDERSTSAFRFTSEGVAWQDNRIGRGEVLRARRSFVLACGSASFREPMEGLQHLGYL